MPYRNRTRTTGDLLGIGGTARHPRDRRGVGFRRGRRRRFGCHRRSRARHRRGRARHCGSARGPGGRIARARAKSRKIASTASPAEAIAFGEPSSNTLSIHVTGDMSGRLRFPTYGIRSEADVDGMRHSLRRHRVARAAARQWFGEQSACVLILGSTRVDGTQALEVIAANSGPLRGGGLARPAAVESRPGWRSRPQTGRDRTSRSPTTQAAARSVTSPIRGRDAVTHLVENTEADVVLNALVGALAPQTHAGGIGEQVSARARRTRSRWSRVRPLVLKAAAPGQIVPVDSEHSAMAQCLRGGTAGRSREDRAHRVGRPVSSGWSAARPRLRPPGAGGEASDLVDGPDEHAQLAPLAGQQGSRTASRPILLFGIDYDRIEVVVHPQSIVHSMVTFTDGSTLAQASPPDMKLPIALALGWPARVPPRPPACDFCTASTWEFMPLDAEVFQLRWTWPRQAGEGGGCLTAVYNAANEEAAGRLPRLGASGFQPLCGTIAEVLRGCRPVGRRNSATVDEVLDAAQRWAR